MKFQVRRDAAGRDMLWLDGRPVPYLPSPNVGGRMSPSLLVWHNTSSWLRKGAAVAWMRKRKARVSAHVTIERDGSVYQLVPLNVQAWHAGRSIWRGRRHCNRFSIGGELVGPGKLTKDGRAWFGGTFDGAVLMVTRAHGRGYWLPYTDAQIATSRALGLALARHYDMPDATGHYEISPGRKIDPNPLFPMDEFKAIAKTGAAMPDEPAPIADVAPPSPYPIGIGSEGPAVLAVQDRLAELGYQPGPRDGDFGRQTRDAVRAWQAANGRPVTGHVTASHYADMISPTAEPRYVGPTDTAQAEQAATALDRVDQAAKAAGSAAVIEGAGQAATGQSLFGAIGDGLSKLSETVGHVTGVGVSVDPQIALVAVAFTVAAAVVVWIKTARGEA